MTRRRFVQALASIALLPSLGWLGVKRLEVPEALMQGHRCTELCGILLEASQRLEDDSGNRPDIVYLTADSAEYNGVNDGDMIAGLRVIVVDESPGDDW